MSEQYADVIVDISHEKLDRAFQYRVPEHLRGKLAVGMRVAIPFGKGDRQIQGYCIGLGEQCKFDPQRIKDIAGIKSLQEDTEGRSVALAAWMREQYGSTMIQALKTVLPARKEVKKLEKRVILRLLGKEEVRSLLGESLRKKQVAKARLLEALLEQDHIPYEWVTGKLNVTAQTISGMERAGIIKIQSSLEYRDPVKAKKLDEEEKHLSAAQKSIIEGILGDYDQGIRKPYLIHGITGSGKTEVYIRLVEGVVERGRQVIVLIPEIALTYQTLLRFYQSFGNRVSVINSSLSAGEKYDQCERAKKGEIDVIIGPRSALFTPFPDLGLIIIDEEHESSYKSESAPKYHARETAEYLAGLCDASLVLGSATPSVEAFYRARNGQYGFYQLTERLTGGALPQVEVVDLRQELRDGNRSIFSRRLQELMSDRLQKGQQTMLFLNRRGYSGFVSCRNCGYVVKCPHCDVSLSEHKGGRMICHYCGHTEPKPALCPECGSKYILGFKAGTQQIEDKLKEIYPGIRTLRMDRDTTGTKDSYEKILSAFANMEADVLIGTQMIVKGHDFPNVTLVGVLAADLSLGAGDYRAEERTFQLLVQAVGRAGRGELAGNAVIQTYQPENYAVLHASRQDYEGFFEEEILYRSLGGYPPTANLLAVQVFSEEEAAGEKLATHLAGIIRAKRTDEDYILLGPAPAGIGRINDIYRQVLYIKADVYRTLVEIKDLLESETEKMQLRTENIQFDFNPINVL